MRDIFFVLIFPLILYAVFKRPFIGAAMWLWVAMFFPNGWVYGFAGSFRYNLIIVVCAVISYLCWKDKEKNEYDTLTFLILFFLFEVFQEFYRDNLLLPLNAIMFFFQNYPHLNYVFHFENHLKASSFWMIKVYL